MSARLPTYEPAKKNQFIRNNDALPLLTVYSFVPRVPPVLVLFKAADFPRGTIQVAPVAVFIPSFFDGVGVAAATCEYNSVRVSVKLLASATVQVGDGIVKHRKKPGPKAFKNIAERQKSNRIRQAY